MKVLVPLLLVVVAADVNGDTISLADIQKAIHGLSTMMEKTWSPKVTNAERKSIFELYTCLSLSRDLELLVFNRTEIFIEDEKQSCSCRRVHGQFEPSSPLSENSTFSTDLFIKMLISSISKYDDSDSLSQSFSHFNNSWLNSRKNESHVHELRDAFVRLTPKENAIQIITRFIIKSWAIKSIRDLVVPVFELYTCTSLLQEAENFVIRHLDVMRRLHIHLGHWYVPCVCHRMQEFAQSTCPSPQHCSPTFSQVHTRYEAKINRVIKNMSLPPEISS